MNQKLDAKRKTYNFNAQSTVVSFMLPNNKIQLICTGDAENDTFELINTVLIRTRETL
jgi:hypothetical protein